MKLLQLLLIGCVLATPLASFSQDDDEAPLIPQEDFDELLMWMVDGKFEKVLYKAIRYTEDDDTSKEPVPYVFMSMAFFKISESDDADLLEKYTNGLKNALKYASKFVKKDKKKMYVGEYTNYFNDLRRATMNQSEVYVDDEKYTKAKSYYKYLYSLDREDPGAWLMSGTVLWRTKAKRDAGEAWALARALLEEFEGRGLEEVQIDLLKYGVIYTAEMLVAEGDRTAALDWLNLTDALFSDDREVQAVRRSIGG
ncbi:MAG: hypothetical protein ACKVJH_07550 [Flavobacteriales bacterium]